MEYTLNKYFVHMKLMAAGQIFIEWGRREIFKICIFKVFINSLSYIPSLQN